MIKITPNMSGVELRKLALQNANEMVKDVRQKAQKLDSPVEFERDCLRGLIKDAKTIRDSGYDLGTSKGRTCGNYEHYYINGLKNAEKKISAPDKFIKMA